CAAPPRLTGGIIVHSAQQEAAEQANPIRACYPELVRIIERHGPSVVNGPIRIGEHAGLARIRYTGGHVRALLVADTAECPRMRVGRLELKTPRLALFQDDLETVIVSISAGRVGELQERVSWIGEVVDRQKRAVIGVAENIVRTGILLLDRLVDRAGVDE